MIGPLLAAALATMSPPAERAAVLAVTRIDCGRFVVHNLEGKGPRTLNNGCYLIRHRTGYLLWDLGLREELIGKPDVSDVQTVSLEEAIIPQLGRLGIKPSVITWIGISHYHGDHLGQATRFPRAKLLIGKADLAAIKSDPASAKRLEPWTSGQAPVIEVDADRDVFGDGSVVMLATPGHTPGHTSLLVRMPERTILLTGDAVHFRDQLASRKPSGNATDLAAAAASITRLLDVANREKATIIVQHDPLDDAALPAVPKERH